MINFTASPFIAIIVMMIATYITRISGILIMKFFDGSNRLEKFCRALSGSVIIALIVPIIVSNDWSLQLAAGISAIIMFFTKNAFLCMIAGAAIAAFFRSYC